MSDISELDLQNLRHLIGGFDTTHCKMQEYAKEAEDPKVKQFFEKGKRNNTQVDFCIFSAYSEGRQPYISWKHLLR